MKYLNINLIADSGPARSGKSAGLLRFHNILSLLMLAILIIGVAGCGKEAPPPGFPPATVLAAKTMQKEMPLAIPAIGTVEAHKTINIYSRVNGQLLQTHFREGQDVRRGQLLFTIDSAAYREKLHQTEAKLAKDSAQLKFNDEEAKRYAFLFGKGAVSKSEADKYLTEAALYSANVKSDRAEVEDARLSLAYCSITAPFDGRTSAYGVNLGTIVRANDTSLTTLNQINPVYVRFSVAERHLADIHKYVKSGSVTVKVSPTKNFTGEVPAGKLVFIDNAIDTNTGMITLKAEFANVDKSLWPGQFVNVSLHLTMQQGAVVAPLRAVQQGDKGQFVFVVKPDMTADIRPVVVDRAMGEEAVIARGLAAGETVITDGHLKVRPGGKVEIKEDLGATQGNSNVKPATGGSGK
ncbi:MAG: efflux RND transporter periplasmic adaptor subunit [Syntrophales bacterium]|nr:efflux RND transporter periplasmic adaptor subunit [Syntrophales bacterium]MCK9390336.1 efflux RND transporter periplasmic adaptor subunit [Syntrophales bacterium]